MNNEAIAKIVYEVNAAYCKSIGDNSFTSWDAAPEWQKQTNIDGVNFIRNNSNAGPDASHNNWLALKEKEGWKYGAVKDPIKKEHPCYLPYDKLPVEQKSKDYIFGALVRALLAYNEGGAYDPNKDKPNSPMTATQTSIQDATTINSEGKMVTDLDKLKSKPL